MIKWAFQALSNDERFGLLFENVEGSSLPICTGLLGASRQAYALALGIEPDDINTCWENAQVNPINPVSVDTAPCQENFQTGEDVRLGELPVPTRTPASIAPMCATRTMWWSTCARSTMAMTSAPPSGPKARPRPSPG